MTKLLGFLLLILTASCCETNFEPNKAQIAVGYATCVNIQTAWISQIYNWTYISCKKFQEKENVESINLIAQPDGYLLALFLYDKANKMNVLSFRASVCSEDNANTLIDEDYRLKDYTEWKIPNAQAHSGFYESYVKLKQRVRKNAMELYNKNKAKNAKFLVTGISLGAALAAFAAFDLANYFQQQGIKNVEWVFYTFGQPRLGNQNFINAINNKITIYRVVNQDDPVPHLPPRKSVITSFYFNPGIQVYLPTNQPNNGQICAGDSSYCSLNKNNFTLDSVCNHIGYPDVDFKSIKSKVEKPCPYDNKIQLYDRRQQAFKDIAFLRKACKLVCTKDSSQKYPECFDNYPEELKCPNKQPGEAQLIWKIRLYYSDSVPIQNDANSNSNVCDICNKLPKIPDSASSAQDDTQL